VPEAIYNYDTEQARASMRKLAGLEPAAAWPGHAKAGHRRRARQLERRRRRAWLSARAQTAQAEGPDQRLHDAHGNVLTLRGSLTPGSRREYAQTLAGMESRLATQEDAWQRAVELLFERLAVRWTIAGAPIERQRELLARFRAASAEERASVREALREHCALHFPDVRAP
jgi:hypothetical protein